MKKALGKLTLNRKPEWHVSVGLKAPYP